MTRRRKVQQPFGIINVREKDEHSTFDESNLRIQFSKCFVTNPKSSRISSFDINMDNVCSRERSS